MPAPGRARPGRDGPERLRRRDDRAGVEKAIGLLAVRQPRCRHGGERDPAAPLVVKPEPPEPLWPDGSPYREPVQLKLPL